MPRFYWQTLCLGLPFEGAGIRIQRLEEAVHILKQFFTQDAITFAGTYYTVTNLQAFPKPQQRPHPPFLMGGGGKKLLTLAEREADSVGLHLKVNDDGTVDASESTEMALSRKVEWVRQAAGERFSAVELNLLVATVIITQDQIQAAEHYIHDNEHVEMTAEQLVASPYAPIGSVEQLVKHLLYLREQFGITYLVVGSECMGTFASVVARLVGA